MDKKKRLECILPMTGDNSSPDTIVSSDNMIDNNNFNLRDFYNVNIDINRGWLTASNSRILRRRMHAHVFLSDFTNAYQQTLDIKYFTESFKILEDWFARYPVSKKDELEEIAFHPEGTAIRLLFWMKYYHTFFELFTENQRILFEKNIFETAQLLNQDEFYAGMTNHGLFQNMGLLAYSIYNDENFQQTQVFQKSLRRIHEYVKEVFTEEGVHKEHSPSYHVLLVYNIKQILETFKLIEFNDQKVEQLNDLFIGMEDYTINIVMPDYKLPNISDGTQFNLSKNETYKTLFNSEEYEFITSGGQNGVSPELLIKSYPKSGYLIARSVWSKEAIYFLFLASYHMHFHKHTDDLSFILYKNGPIFIDAGPFSYDYKNPFTQYAYSQFAHSTLVINDNSLPRTDNKFNDIYINEHQIDNQNQKFYVEGVNNRYGNSKHTRGISGDLKHETFKITDKVVSDTSNQYKILFQINGDLEVIHNGQIISIFKNNAKVAELEVEDTTSIEGLRIYTVCNQKFPKIMGYQFPKIESVKPSKTIIIEGYNKGKESEIITNIRLTEYKIKGNANFGRKNEIQHFRDLSYIYENHNNSKLAIVFNASEGQYNYKLDEYEELIDKDFNILYLIDNQAPVGRSFIQGESSSSIESDVLCVINQIKNTYSFTNEDVHIFGRSKGGYAALYFSLLNGFNNVYLSTPLMLIGDYYTRYDKYEPVIKTLGLSNKESIKYYLNDYLNNIDNYIKISNLNICIGENDYHKQKHTDYLTKWLEEKGIKYNQFIYPNADFSADKEEFINFIKNYNFE